MWAHQWIISWGISVEGDFNQFCSKILCIWFNLLYKNLCLFGGMSCLAPCAVSAEWTFKVSPTKFCFFRYSNLIKLLQLRLCCRYRQIHFLRHTKLFRMSDILSCLKDLSVSVAQTLLVHFYNREVLRKATSFLLCLNHPLRSFPRVAGIKYLQWGPRDSPLYMLNNIKP